MRFSGTWVVVSAVALAILVVLALVLRPVLRDRTGHLFRGIPGFLPAALVLLVFLVSLVPMWAHLQAESDAQRHRMSAMSEEILAESPERSLHAFEATTLDVLYGSIQLFTANMQPVTASNPSPSLRVLRIIAPLLFVVWIAAAFSRVARALWTRAMLRHYSGHIVVCGPPERILSLVSEAKGNYCDDSTQKRVIAVTSGSVDRAVERALLKIPARVIDLIPYSSTGAFANAVSQASHVFIDFDDVEKTFEFAESAMQVGAPGWRPSWLPGRVRKWVTNSPAQRVIARAPFDVPPEFLHHLVGDDRFTVECRHAARLPVEQTDVRRASPNDTLRLLVITDKAEFVREVKVLRRLFRQAEPGLVDVLLIGDDDAELPIDPTETTAWLRVRRASGRGVAEHAVRALVKGRPLGDDRPAVRASAPVFIHMRVYRALSVMAELDRIAKETGIEPLPIAYIASGASNADQQPEAPKVERVIPAFDATIQVIGEQPDQLLDSVRQEVTVKNLAAHLALWGADEERSILGPRAQHPLLSGDKKDLRRFVNTVIEHLEKLGFSIKSTDEVDSGDRVIGLGPQHLADVLRQIGGPNDCQTSEVSVKSLERRGAMLDLLSRFPEWLGRGGFVLMGRSDAVPSVRLSDDDIRQMATEAHAVYLEALARENGEAVGDRKALSEYQLLPDEYKESNRQQVRHLPVKLALLGLDLARDREGDSEIASAKWPPQPGDPLSAAFEALSRLEHARWCIERLSLGYQHGLRRQDRDEGGELTHPDLVPYDELPDSVKAFDVSVVENIPRVLASAGFAWPLNRPGNG